jgi:hypothetical protein
MTNHPTVQLPPDLGGPEPGIPPAPRRRGLCITLIAAAAVLVPAIPFILYFVLRGNPRQEATNPPATTGPTATVPAAPVPTPTVSHGTPAPDGRIPLSGLKNATLDIPTWPADNLTGLSGRLTFVEGEVRSPRDAAFRFERYIVILDASTVTWTGTVRKRRWSRSAASCRAAAARSSRSTATSRAGS